MSNNVTIRNATGVTETLATNEVGGVHFQNKKLVDGRDQGTTPMVVRADPPGSADGGAVVRQAPIDITTCSFAQVGSSLLSTDMTQRRLGTGVGVTQGSGNLLVTTGTSTNAEFLARSVKTFNGALIARIQTILSQRIANNNFMFLLADLIGEGLACTINSATSISVTKTAHGFTAENVGQFMMVGAISAGAAGVPGRYAIASIPDANTINFTVAGWPASGSCTLDLFGWSHYKLLYNGTTATAAAFDAQRRGWASGDTTLAINTTASPGHVAAIANDGRNAYVSDILAASSVTPAMTTRGSRVANLPDPEVEMYLYLWSFNGTTAPASTTTWTVGFWAVEDTTNTVVYLGGVRHQGQAAPLPATLVGAPAISGTVTASNAAGTAAAGATASGNPVQIGTIAQTAQPTARTAGQIVAPLYSKVGHAITMTGQVRDLNDTTAPITLTATTETTLIAAVAATFNDIYSLTITNTSATGVRVDLRSVAAGTVLDSFWVPATTTLMVNPAVPYKQATVNTAWTVQLSAAVTDVRISARSVRNI